MASPTAQPSDVRLEYDTYLDDTDVNAYLQRAVDEIDQYVDLSGMDSTPKKLLEAAYAAYLIATRSSDRAESQASAGSSSVSYETDVVDEIRSTIEEYDPSGKLPVDDSRGGSFEVF